MSVLVKATTYYSIYTTPKKYLNHFYFGHSSSMVCPIGGPKIEIAVSPYDMPISI